MVGLTEAGIDGKKGVDEGEDEDVKLGFEKCPDGAGLVGLLSGGR